MTGRPDRVRLLADADSDVLGERFPFFQDLLTSEAADAPLWEAIDASDKVAPRDAAVLSVAGWYDIFLTGQVADYHPWGALTRSHAAAASYSWISPPSRSRRRIAIAALMGSPRGEGIGDGSGACRASARCGLCWL
jgi:X-Pro dipeptidyl-peptidase (S15 family)